MDNIWIIYLPSSMAKSLYTHSFLGDDCAKNENVRNIAEVLILFILYKF